MAALPQGAAAAALNLLIPPVDPYQANPVAFASDVLGFHAWSKQREILNSIRDHERTAVRACHGPGKTATAAQGALWFLKSHPNSRVITTAPTWAQVEQLLWREIRAAVGRSHRLGRTDFPKASATKLELGDEWFAIGLSTNEPERFQGHHADDILLLVDEASGVDEKIYEAAEGFLTATGARMALFGNPTRIGGQFYRAFTSEREQWNTVHISVFDTPNYTGEKVPDHVARSLPRASWAAEKAAQWGIDSPMYQVRVLGNFPSNAEKSVIPLSTVEAAQARELPVPYPAQQHDVVIACDVARFGSDETVIGTRYGPQVRMRESYNGKDTMKTAGRIIHWWRVLRMESGANPSIVVDDDGVGGGVTDRLREQGFEVTAFNGGGRAIQADDYVNRRSEMWFVMGDRLPYLDLDGDDQLAADLTSPEYDFRSDGRRFVEAKEHTKKRLGRSPDRGDMALLSLVRPPVITLPDPARAPERDTRDWDAPPPRGGSLTGDLLDDPM